MRNLKSIFKEASTSATEAGCQSWNTICLLSMEAAVKECIEEIIEKLQALPEQDVEINNLVHTFRTGVEDLIAELESTIP